jgi:hypothetical protein
MEHDDPSLGLKQLLRLDPRLDPRLKPRLDPRLNQSLRLELRLITWNVSRNGRPATFCGDNPDQMPTNKQ